LKCGVPTHSTLQLLARNLRDEPSTQLKTYIYSMFMNFANVKTHIPEVKRS
jgi:hypothetical protein